MRTNEPAKTDGQSDDPLPKTNLIPAQGTKLPSKARRTLQPLEPAEVIRSQLAAANMQWKATVALFAEYVDASGEASKGSRGVATQFSARMKRAFAVSVDDASPATMVAMTAGLLRATEIVEDGMRDGLLRRAIKNRLWNFVDTAGAAHRAESEL